MGKGRVSIFGEHGESFIKIIKKQKNEQSQPEKINTPTSKSKATTDSPREKTFSMIKLHLSNLEADFISFKENTNKQIRELKETIHKKDEEIRLLKNEITSLKSTNKDKQQTMCDLTSKQLCMEEQINKINNEHDKQGKLIQNICKKQNVFETEATETKPQPSTTTNDNNNEDKCTYSIPTSNNFDVLNKETSNLPVANETNQENITK